MYDTTNIANKIKGVMTACAGSPLDACATLAEIKLTVNPAYANCLNPFGVNGSNSANAPKIFATANSILK